MGIPLELSTCTCLRHSCSRHLLVFRWPDDLHAMYPLPYCICIDLPGSAHTSVLKPSSHCSLLAHLQVATARLHSSADGERSPARPELP